MNAKLKQRLERLLAMSQDKSSENEALIAARRLHALLSQHGLEEADLGTDTETVGEEYMETSAFAYRRSIVYAIAELYYCQMYYVNWQKNKSRLFVVGKPHHRNIALSISVSVLKIIDREAAKASIEHTGKRTSSFITSFRNGAAQRIRRRCNDLIEAGKAGTLVDDETGNTLPVLASLYDTENEQCLAFMAGMDLTIKSSRVQVRNRTAESLGKQTANGVPISQSLPKTAPLLLN